MYITNTTDNVEKIIEKIEVKNDISKLKFLIYLFGLLNNNQINESNDPNPNLNKEDNFKILDSENIGLSNNVCTRLLQYFVMLYNNLTEVKSAYEDNGNVIGIKYSDDETKLLSDFEKLSFNEKLDVLSEIIIRYDNESYFDKKIAIVFFGSEMSGYDIANRIKEFKIND